MFYAESERLNPIYNIDKDIKKCKESLEELKQYKQEVMISHNEIENENKKALSSLEQVKQDMEKAEKYINDFTI